jgi:hypothetical protein
MFESLLKILVAIAVVGVVASLLAENVLPGIVCVIAIMVVYYWAKGFS